MRIVLGVLEADAGVVTWRGADSRTLPRATWGYLPEERGLYPRMTVIDQLVYFAALYGVAPGGRAARRSTGWTASACRTSPSAGPTSCRRATSRRSS